MLAGFTGFVFAVLAVASSVYAQGRSARALGIPGRFNGPKAAQPAAQPEAQPAAQPEAQGKSARELGIPARVNGAKAETPAADAPQGKSANELGLPGRVNGAKGKKSDGSEFVIPENATPQELFEKANTLLNTDQTFDTEEEYTAWVQKMIQTVYGISNRILKMDVDDDTYKKAISLKGEMLYYHVWAKPEAFDQYEKFVRETQQDERLLKAEGGQKIIDGQIVSFLHEGCIRAVQKEGTAADLQKYIDEFQEIVLRDPEFVSMIPNIVYPVTQMATAKKDPKLLKDVFLKFAGEMDKSDNQTLKDAASGLKGILRFAELDGKPMKVVGTLANGEKFNQDTLKDKVYLVDFWATWVTPCIAQYPELLALYVQYHDKGFEIVGYNMDTELEKFTDYVDSKNVPWPNISEKMSTDNKQPSLSEFYGITTMPTLVLVGKDGNVIKNDIDIETLKTKLAEEFK